MANEQGLYSKYVLKYFTLDHYMQKFIPLCGWLVNYEDVWTKHFKAIHGNQ